MYSDLEEIKGIGPKIKDKLSQLNIFDIQDLLMFLPSGYLDLDAAYDISNAENGAFAVGKLTVSRISNPFQKGRVKILKVFCRDENGCPAEIIWYNANYLSKTILPGDKLVCYGKVTKDKIVHFSNPIYKVLKEDSDEGFRGIRPIYPTRGLIPQGTFFKFISQALKVFELKSIIPANLERHNNLAQLNESIRFLHAPDDLKEIGRFKTRIQIEERVRIMCAFNLASSHYKRGHIYTPVKDIWDKVKDLIPFELSESQCLALKNIIELLTESKNPLNSILIGDVGSGKTIVAALAAYFATLSKHQVAILAPTEVLAVQHYSTFNKYLGPAGVSITLLTGSLTKEEKLRALEELSQGSTDIVIGTHAILENSINFRDLSLVITDEQHKFGVGQRTALLNKGIACDLLSLSATPIPRSMNIMMLGNITIFNIEKRNAGENIITATVPSSKRVAMFEYVVSACEKGTQAFIVVPRVYDMEGIECDSIQRLEKELKNLYGGRIKLLSLHGKMSAEEKNDKMAMFRRGEAEVMLATSLIEVGIDIPNASIIVVMNADRFGLASLHQLRGRVGRAGQKSYCFLYSENEIISERLEILTKENNGIEVAEKDCALRGMGEIYSETQSGSANSLYLNYDTLKLCLQISKNIKAESHYELLYKYMEKHNLKNVSLN